MTPAIDLRVLAPIGFVAIGSMVVLVGEVLFSRMDTIFGRPMTRSYAGTLSAILSMVFLALSFNAACAAFAGGGSRVFLESNPMFRLDEFSAMATALLAMTAFLTCGYSISYLPEIGEQHGEFHALILLSTAGMMVLVASVDLISLFVGFELMSFPIYILAGFDRKRRRSNESSLKYFVIGSFASAILLYGSALLYGAAGTTAYAGIRAGLEPVHAIHWAAIALLIVGFVFKVAAVPFHQWAPDVYEGAPSIVTAFMSVAVKAAAFFALMRFLVTAIGPVSASLVEVFSLVAILTMIVGNVMALIQESIKRMLAYSSIAHAGYLMLGVATLTPDGFSAVAFYLVVYAFMNMGAFGVVSALAKDGRDFDRIEDFAGLARVRPGVAAAMAVFLFGLAGMPGTAGFIGKFNLVTAAVHAEMIWLPITLVLTSVISLFYYLRIPVLMYMRDGTKAADARRIGGSVSRPFCVAAVLFFGIFPNGIPISISGIRIDLRILDWASRGVQSLFGA